MASRKLIVEIVGDSRSLERSLNRSSKETRSFGGTLSKLGKTGAVAAGAAGVGALVFTLKTGIGEWVESQKVAAQTNAVLKSTGGIAGITKKHVDDLADSILRKTGIDDEATRTSENLLLAFTNIRNEAGKGNDVFDRTVKVVQDYSVRTGKSATQASIAFGKAMNDPVKGLGALGRAGVVLTDKQKKLIKGWAEHGDTLKAQQYLLKQLETRFGGAAEAAGKTLPGQINILRESFKNWAGDMVGKMIPVLERFIAWFRSEWPEIRDAITHVWKTDIKPTFDAFVDAAIAVYTAIHDNWDTIGPIVKGIGKIIENTIGIATDILKVFADLLRGDWSAAWVALKDAVGKALDNIKILITTWFTTAKKLGGDIAGKLKDGLVEGLKALPGLAWDGVKAIGAKYIEMYATVLGWGADLAVRLRNGIINGVTGIGGATWDVINNIGQWVRDKAGAILDWGVSIGTGIIKGIAQGIKGLGKTIGSFAGGIAVTVGNAVVDLMNTVIGRVNAGLEFTIPMPSKIPDIHVNPPDIPLIPHLAKGGIVNGPTLALIGESGPEAVVPLSGGRGMGATVNNFYFPNYTGDKADLMRVVSAGVRDLERNGTTLGGTRVRPGFAT